MQMLLPLALLPIPVWGAPLQSCALRPPASAAIEVLTVDLNHDGLVDAVVAPTSDRARKLLSQVRRSGKPVAPTSATSYLDRKPGTHPVCTVRAVNAVGSSADSAAVRP